MTKSTVFCFLALVPLGVLSAGCSGGSPTVFDVSGKVNYDGKPLPAGRISFQPDSTKGNQGPAGFADITDGQYDTSKGGKGVVGGPHFVTISGYDGKADPAAELPIGNSLFQDYRVNADLPKEKSTKDFDVPKGGRSPDQPRVGAPD